MGTSPLLDKVLLITGSTGIAEATAELAAEAGAKLFITSRTPENAEALAKKTGAKFLAADLVRSDAAPGVVDACVAAYGRLDAVYNVAGISGRKFGDGPLHECTEEG